MKQEFIRLTSHNRRFWQWHLVRPHDYRTRCGIYYTHFGNREDTTIWAVVVSKRFPKGACINCKHGITRLNAWSKTNKQKGH